MKNLSTFLLLLLASFFPLSQTRGEEKPLPQAGDYAEAMKKVARKFKGREGVVLHIGDSITYSNPYGQWPRAGEGKSDDDKAILKWMHTGADNDTDGWWLARFDHPAGGRSYTACSGIRVEEMLAGGKQQMPPLAKILDTYKPRLVVLMLGTNDATAGRSVEAYSADMAKCVDLMVERGIVPILSTIPPHPGQLRRAQAYNEALRDLAKKRELPLIDYEKEILKRRPDDWNGTLLGKNDVHPSVEFHGTKTTSPPTAENLKNSGYLLRGWLSVKKIAEVKRKVIDRLPAPKAPEEKATPEGSIPKGEAVRVAVTRDTWFSNVGNEADANLGGSSRLKVKSIQEMSLLDIDAKPLRGRVITGAMLHLHLAGEERLYRVTVGSFGAEWVEGTSESYAPQKGSSTFHHRRHPDVPWTVPGSDLCSVMLGEGGTQWRMADASAPDERRWQRVAVDPSILAARVAGISYGFLVFDDTGSEWTRQGEQFTYRLFPNRFLHSRESGAATAPYLTVFLGAEDKRAPETPGDLRADVKELPAGETWLSWTTPKDEGAGTLGFFVTVDGKDVPRYLIPTARKPGETVRMHLRDLDLKPGAEVEVAVRAVDGAGNIGRAATAKVRVSDRSAAPLPGVTPKPFAEKADLPRLGEAEIAIVDELDKVHPVSGEMIPKQADGYLAANHLWNAKDKHIRLHAGRNEFIAFQVLLHGRLEGVRPKLTFAGEDGEKIHTSWGTYHLVPSAKGSLPDPIVPLSSGGLSVPSAGANRDGQKYAGLHAEIYVPHTIQAGEHKGRLTLTAGEETLALDVSLRVWDFTLPDYLSFLPEMNCYGLPANERDYYRLAHRHRTVLNRVPYSQSGIVANGCAPHWDGERLDWSVWDRRFGSYFDGAAFADLPRRRVPLEIFYLPLHENWPTPMEGNYNGSYWADRAFPASYRRSFVEVSRQMAEHFQDKKWHDTLFHVFLNNKVDFKRNGWSRGSSPWLLDEPANWQDYWALRYFGAAFHEGRNRAPGQAKLVFRCDISRPQWQRDAFDGLLDYNVVGGAMRQYPRLVFDRKSANGEIVVEYGGSNALEDSNMQAVGWALDSWSRGSDGVLPWQTVGNGDSWRRADPLSLFYPGRGGQEREPIPSIRLKAYRRGQQDVEYLTLLSQITKQPRWAIGQRVREVLHLVGERKGTGFVGEDAGVIHFAQLKPQDVWALRVRIGEALSKAAPEPKRRLIELRTPPRHPEQLTSKYVSTSEGK